MAKSLDETIAANEAKRREIVEKMILSYYNNTLLEKGLISPDNHHIMRTYIATRKSAVQER